MAGQRPSFPVPSEPSLRRLGVGGIGGGPGSGGERPLRAQIIVALCATVLLVAVPMYLLRGPTREENVVASAATAPVVPSLSLKFDAGQSSERVRLGPAQRVKCGSSRASRGQEGVQCDRLPFFEEALAKAIRDNIDCAPKEDEAGTINYALEVDFKTKRVTVFPGASGDWKGPQPKRSAQCVSRSLPVPTWESLRHQHRYYLIAVLATYPAPPRVSGPDFE